MRWLISHTSIGEEGPDLFWPFFSYASDADLRRNRKESLVPENGDTGVVEPAGEARGDPLSYPGGFTIMMLRVTLVVCSDDSSPYDLTLPASISDQSIFSVSILFLIFLQIKNREKNL